MVHRADKGKEFKRWYLYLPMKSQERTWKKTLRHVIEKGRAKIGFVEVSKHRVELVWPEPVTSCAVKRLIKIARDYNPDFEVSGEPLGLEDGAARLRRKLRRAVC